MIHPELVRLRLGLGSNPDPKALYRYRLDALRMGCQVTPIPGDRVKVDDVEGRVVAVTESISGPATVTWHDERGDHDALETDVRVLVPHRPAMLLGEDELHKRAEEDAAHPDKRRALETLDELARREEKEGIPLALSILAKLDGAPNDDLRRTLKGLLRSRAAGEVEVALRDFDIDDDALPRVELPALLASVTDEQIATDVLDRLENLAPADAVHVINVSGRWLVGAGGPAFAQAEQRERVSSLAREHPDHDVRVALFVQAARALQPDDLLEAALQSEHEDVRAGAAMELLRRGKTDPVWSYLEGETRPAVLLELLHDAERTQAVFPLSLLGAWLERGLQGQDDSASRLAEAALLRLPEVADAGAALALVEPWLAGEGDDAHRHAALWAAGLIGGEHVGDRILGLLHKQSDLPLLAVGLEALTRLGHEHALGGVDAWGVPIVKAGPWGEEVVDVCGLVLGRQVDPNELVQRFVIDPPLEAVRKARLLELAHALHARGEENVAVRLTRSVGPCRLRRYADLVAASKG